MDTSSSPKFRFFLYTHIQCVRWYYSDVKSLPDRQTIPSNVDIQFIHQLPIEFLNETNEPMLVVIDDLMDEAMNSLAVSQLFTKGVHHQNISAILLTQNIYNPGKYSRNISLNSSFYVLFRNLRDMQQINRFFQQMCGNNSRTLQDVYKDATSRPHGYLFIDLSQSGHTLLRLRTNVFEGKVCYCPIKELNSINGAYPEEIECGQVYALSLAK